LPATVRIDDIKQCNIGIKSLDLAGEMLIVFDMDVFFKEDLKWSV